MSKKQTATDEVVNQETPPIRRCDLFKRDDCGLLEGVDYVYRDNNTINWRAMVNPEHTVINGQYKNELEQIHQKQIEDIQVADVDDKYLLILLAGFKELALIRGYTNVHYNVIAASSEYVGTSCEITWIPNFETNYQLFTFESLADAHLNNASGFAKNYLMAIAENRAFVRCVRNSLGIHVLGKDELNPKDLPMRETAKTFSPIDPHGVLQSVLQDKKREFPKFKEEWISLGHEEAKEWTTLADIPTVEVYRIIEAIRTK